MTKKLPFALKKQKETSVVTNSEVNKRETLHLILWFLLIATISASVILLISLKLSIDIASNGYSEIFRIIANESNAAKAQEIKKYIAHSEDSIENLTKVASYFLFFALTSALLSILSKLIDEKKDWMKLIGAAIVGFLIASVLFTLIFHLVA